MRTHWNGLATRSTGGAKTAFDSNAITSTEVGIKSPHPSRARAATGAGAGLSVPTSVQ